MTTETPMSAEVSSDAETSLSTETSSVIATPASAEPSAEVEKPSEAEPSAEAEAPPKAEPPAEAEAPPKAEPSAEAETPPKAEPSAKAEKPASDKASPKGEKPASTDAPAEVKTPFDGVPAQLQKAFEKKGYSGLTEVQSAIVSAISSGAPRNLRISSQTGSGKTVALGIALAKQLLASPREGANPRALIITPTRELAAQVRAELDWLFGFTNFRTDVMIGGTDVRAEKRRLDRCADIIVGTPGRLLDHIKNKNLDCSGVQGVVLDEADQMLDMGFKDELDDIVASLPEERLSHLVSATFPAAVRRLAASFQSNALSVEGTKLGAANASIEHVVYLVAETDRYAALVNLLLQYWGQRCLVFVQTRNLTADLSERLAGDGFSALPFSGDLAQAQRTRTLNAFKNGIINTLIATDVAARGIDVPDISVVIHGDLPKETDVYTHRSGRTGRAGKTGSSLIIATPREEARTRRLLSNARIDASWGVIPTAKKIRQRVTKETRRELYANLLEADTKLNEGELEYAEQLLTKEDPKRIVAMLLQMAETTLPREPMEPRAAQGMPARPVRGRQGGTFARFFINWGAKHGANASRILSHVCRRGNIHSGDIGSIDVTAHSSTVEVNTHVAMNFERLVKKPDPRDPNVAISRDRSAGAPAANGPPRRSFGPPGGHGGSNESSRADANGRVARAQRGKRTRPTRPEE